MPVLTASYPPAYVSCNVYITAAISQSIALQTLLRYAQEQCRFIRQGKTNTTKQSENLNLGGVIDLDIDNISNTRNLSNIHCFKGFTPVAVIHAFADNSYNRSSFHLAGRSDCVADVASALVLNALENVDLHRNNIGGDCNNCNEEIIHNNGMNVRKRESWHPYVGLIDHVSVMALASFPALSIQSNSDTSIDSDNVQLSQRAAVDVAKKIGHDISTAHDKIKVHYYGLACPENTPLAKVRREKTSFFQSDTASNKVFEDECFSKTSENNLKSNASRKGDTTIGVPHYFVENLNIRLTSNVDLIKAKSLTQYLRGRNIAVKGWGVEGVEALTLPYKRLRRNNDTRAEDALVYEVACNLTNPKKGSAQKLQESIHDWVAIQKDDENDYNYFIDQVYRVGTTEEQCKETLRKGYNFDGTSDEKYWEDHDNNIFHQFQDFLTK